MGSLVALQTPQIMSNKVIIPMTILFLYWILLFDLTLFLIING